MRQCPSLGSSAVVCEDAVTSRARVRIAGDAAGLAGQHGSAARVQSEVRVPRAEPRGTRMPSSSCEDSARL
eukprot:204736-Prymnesium_polylepis.1